MLIGLIFNLFLIVGFAIVWVFGESTERRFVCFLLLATFFTFLSNTWLGRGSARLAISAIDMSVLALAVMIALRSDRYWPVWFSGFHSLAVLSGLQSLLVSERYAAYFWAFSGFWALPAVLAMAVGIVLDDRSQKLEYVRQIERDSKSRRWP